MFSFKEFMLNEAAGKTAKVQSITLDIAKNFDLIKDAKKAKKPNDVNSEVQSILKQADLYTKISNLMKSLAVELKKPIPPEKDKKITDNLY